MKYIKKNDIISSTYHFIRNNNDQKYRNIKFFSTNLFEEQLNFFIKKFNIIDSNSLLEILSQKKNKSKKPFMLLTFDDGYIDHYKYVYPLLLKKRLKGFFYPITKTIYDRNFITFTNKIHFILARSINFDQIFFEIENFIVKKTNLDMKNIYNKAKKIKIKQRRFDNPNSVIIKNIFNFAIPDVFKSKLVDYIFKKIITKNNTAFAKNIYLKKSHIIEMNSDKMHFGTHSSSHLWLGKNTKIKQERDIKKSIYDLQRILGKNEILSICYPFGSYNKETIQIVKKLGFLFGFSNKYGKINSNTNFNRYTIPRFDCKDF